MESERVIIAVGFGNMSSAVAALSVVSFDAVIATKRLNNLLNELKERTPWKTISRDELFVDEALKFRSFQEDLNTIVYEKVQNKFISKPRNNFRRR